MSEIGRWTTYIMNVAFKPIHIDHQLSFINQRLMAAILNYTALMIGMFMRCSLWRDAAENVAESLTKGMRVIAQGRLVQRSYTTREGEQRTVVEMQVDEIGPSLRYAKAQVTRNSRGGGNYGGNNAGASNGGGYGGSQGGYNANNNASAGGYSGYNSAPQGGSAGDPWATGGSSFGDEPPF